ncbi:MAG: hypothetical protein V4819_12120 [Verrucomicrobiota bacterium]
MKHTTLPILTGLALLVASCGEKKSATVSNPAESQSSGTNSFVLAQKHYLPPAGTVATKNTSMVMTDSAMTVKAGPQEMQGTASRTETGVETLEVLSKDKIRRLQVSKKASGKMTMNGQDQPSPETPDPLEGIPVILERKGETWTASLENGAAPAPEQQKRLDRMVAEIVRDSDFQMYGDTPRSPGDKWQVDPAKIGAFDEVKSVTGTYSVEFVEVKEFDGVRCAVLKATYDFKGKSEASDESQAMDIAMKGEAISRRSIADQFDLGVEIKGTMTVDGSPVENVTMHIVGPMTMTQKVALKKP